MMLLFLFLEVKYSPLDSELTSKKMGNIPNFHKSALSACGNLFEEEILKALL